MFLVLVAFAVVPLTLQMPRFSFPPPDEYVQIDGSKNPEMVPQWSAWEFAFRVLAGGSRLLPTSVHRVVSSAEARMVLTEAHANQERMAACEKRVLALRPLLATESARTITEKTREIQLDCRWQTLHARDRALEALRDNPEGLAALIEWVESTKSGTQISVPKSELAHFKLPQ